MPHDTLTAATLTDDLYKIQDLLPIKEQAQFVRILLSLTAECRALLVDLCESYWAEPVEQRRWILLQEMILAAFQPHAARDDVSLMDIEYTAAELTDHRISVGKTVSRIRTNRAFTQPQLAEGAGLSQSQISKIENGLHCATQQTIEKIAVALGVKISEIDPSYDA